jgi:hypothetical protein
MKMEFDQEAGVFLVLAGVLIGLGAGFFIGNYSAYTDYSEAYNGFISQDNYESVMVRETISSYNSSLDQFEKNNSEAGYDLAYQGTIHIWGLMKSHDKALYEPIFKRVTSKCFASERQEACTLTLESAINNLEMVQEEKLNKTEEEKGRKGAGI